MAEDTKLLALLNQVENLGCVPSKFAKGDRPQVFSLLRAIVHNRTMMCNYVRNCGITQLRASIDRADGLEMVLSDIPRFLAS
jgi:hypothetical protein